MHKTLIRDISEHSARVDFTTYLDNEVSSGGAHVFFIESGTGHLYAYFDFIFPLSFLSVSLSILFLSLSLFFSTHVHDDGKNKSRKKKKEMNFSSFMEENH